MARRSYRLFEWKDHASANRLDDGRRPGLFAVHRVVEVDVLLRVDVGHRSATDDGWHAVGQQLLADRQDAGGSWAADELVRREDDRVLVGEGVLAGGGRHVDLDVGAGRGEVPDRQCAVLVKEL